MKPSVVIACAFWIVTRSVVASPAPSDEQKRIFVQIVSHEGEILAVGLVVIAPEDAAKTFGELVERQIGAQWWGFSRGAVYRFSMRAQAWEAIMTRDVRKTDTTVGGMSGLRLSELHSGDIVRLSGEAEF